MSATTLLELFSDPKRWTQGALARDANGMKRAIWEPEATCFCLVGGIKRVYDTAPGEPKFLALKEKLKATPTWQQFDYRSIPMFNDNVDYDNMIQMLKEAGI